MGTSVLKALTCLTSFNKYGKAPTAGKSLKDTQEPIESVPICAVSIVIGFSQFCLQRPRNLSINIISFFFPDRQSSSTSANLFGTMSVKKP